MYCLCVHHRKWLVRLEKFKYAVKDSIFHNTAVAVWLMIEKQCQRLDMCQGDGDRGIRSVTGLSGTQRDVRDKRVGG